MQENKPLVDIDRVIEFISKITIDKKLDKERLRRQILQNTNPTDKNIIINITYCFKPKTTAERIGIVEGNSCSGCSLFPRNCKGVNDE